jgi:NAD(P)H-dependent flavin oxidoreductase YrpB (nitropropane dioxygenase family)
MNMGTRFIATKEAPVHDNVKQALVAASELDTRLVMRPLRNTERVLKNAAVDRLLEKEKALGAEPQVRGHHRRGRRRLSEDHEGRRRWKPAPGRAAWSPGLIHDIPTCKELIDRLVGNRCPRVAAAIITGLHAARSQSSRRDV